MSYIPFILLSAPEYIVVLVFIMTFFRIKISGFYPQIFFIAIMLGNVSYATRADEILSKFSPIFQVVMFAILIWMLFRVHIFYSTIITTIGYASYALIQVLLVFIFTETGLISMQEVTEKLSFESYIVPLCSMVLMLLLTWLIKRYDFAIDWIPNTHRAKVVMRGENNVFLVLTLLTLAVLIVLYYVLVIGLAIYYISALLTIGCLIFVLLYLSKKRDELDD
ncbi:hypothetical protein IDH44_13635 [Paenibacillus sp. IB182496]|uniref:Uncharacterized protein n=1 Tax=Paenibacillus sabuli TaxID=2772509 RepID=A0A927GT14_9BACL|nr:hypothetical protein [Paenibacillus sabuli]MBD2846242.1 hypothetical protein [Paenibacillus sabuli]